MFSTALRIRLCLALIAFTFTACSRDPNVRKHKYFEDGERYYAAGKYREAEIEFVNAIQIDQNYADAHYRLAQTDLKLNQPTRAFQELIKTIDLQPENYLARIDLTRLLIAEGQLQLGKEHLDWLLKNRPNDPKVHGMAADLLSAQGEAKGAILEAQKAIELSPADGALYLRLALLQLKDGQSDAAERNFKKAVELDPESLTAWLTMGTYHQGRGWYGQAEQELNRAVAVAPKDPQPRIALLQLYMVQGRRAEAEQFAKQVKHDFSDNPVGYRVLGDFYILAGDLDKAVAEYAALDREHPNDPVVKKQYVQLLISTHRIAEAQALNEKILKTSPGDNQALLNRGQLEILAGDANAASSTLQTVIKNEPSNAEAHYQLGVAFQHLGKMADAEAEWREAVRLRPDMVDAQRSLALLAMHNGDMVSLQQAASQIIKLQPSSPDGYSLLALSEINRKLYPAADENIRRAIAIAPQSHLGYVQLGTLRWSQRRYQEARDAYLQALERDPDSTDALRGLMNTYVDQNQLQGAIAAANVQIAKQPKNSSFYDLLGSALSLDKRNLGAAETAFQKSIELDANNIDALTKLGQVQAANGEIDKAIDTYNRAIKDHSRTHQFYFLLGGLYETKSDWSNAQEAYQKALELKPNDPATCNNLANVLLQGGGNVDVAMSLAQTARQGMPDSPNAADTLGWVYYEKGVYHSAISQLQEALKLQGKYKSADSPDIHYHLGLAYLKTEQQKLAREQFERTLKLDPNYREASEIKRLLSSMESRSLVSNSREYSGR